MHIAFSSLSTMAARRSVPLIARRTFRLVFRYCREGAEPHTAGGLEQSQRQQYHRQRTRRGNIFSVPRLSDTPVRGVRGESTCHAYSVFVMAEGLCFNRASSKAKSGSAVEDLESSERPAPIVVLAAIAMTAPIRTASAGISAR